MKKAKELARLFLDLKLGVRPIARACNISTSTSHVYVDRLKELNVPYQELGVLGEDALEELLFPKEEKVPRGEMGSDLEFGQLSLDFIQVFLELPILLQKNGKSTAAYAARSRLAVMRERTMYQSRGW